MTAPRYDAARPPLVLVVDDEPDIRDTLALILKMERYRVATASHAAMALELAEAQAPDLVISDFMMPWMDGRELISRLKESDGTRGVPAIMMSAVTPGEPHPWDAYLRKPVEIDELLDTARRLIAQRR